MRTYVIKSGDYLTKIADREGIDPDVLWNDPANADLVALRKNPNVLLAGDVLHIPEIVPATLKLTAGTENRFTVDLPTVKVHLVFAKEGAPLANEAFEVHGMGAPVPGTTDGSGGADLSVTPLVEQVVVKFPGAKVSFKVQVGHLDPLSEDSGVLQRLANLGYAPPEPRRRRKETGVVSNKAALQARRLEQAVRAFQKAQGLPETGVLDDATRGEIGAAHGA